MDEKARQVERETTVIHTREGGGGGLIAAIVLLFVIGAIAFFFFGGYFEKATEDVNVNVSVETPNIELPDVQVVPPPATEPANGT
jgi:hypothetical protein